MNNYRDSELSINTNINLFYYSKKNLKVLDRYILFLIKYQEKNWYHHKVLNTNSQSYIKFLFAFIVRKYRI